MAEILRLLAPSPFLADTDQNTNDFLWGNLSLGRDTRKMFSGICSWLAEPLSHSFHLDIKKIKYMFRNITYSIKNIKNISGKER